MKREDIHPPARCIDESLAGYVLRVRRWDAGREKARVCESAAVVATASFLIFLLVVLDSLGLL